MIKKYFSDLERFSRYYFSGRNIVFNIVLCYKFFSLARAYFNDNIFLKKITSIPRTNAFQHLKLSTKVALYSAAADC